MWAFSGLVVLLCMPRGHGQTFPDSQQIVYVQFSVLKLNEIDAVTQVWQAHFSE
jgi:hypothetical protein